MEGLAEVTGFAVLVFTSPHGEQHSRKLKALQASEGNQCMNDGVDSLVGRCEGDSPWKDLEVRASTL